MYSCETIPVQTQNGGQLKNLFAIIIIILLIKPVIIGLAFIFFSITGPLQ